MVKGTESLVKDGSWQTEFIGKQNMNRKFAEIFIGMVLLLFKGLLSEI